MDWKKYFEIMSDWKKLPAYKAEPRVDSLIGFYLPGIMADFFKERVKGIIPELPIRKGTIDASANNRIADLSFKVDFYVLGQTGKNYFIEFKTDTSSRRDNQDWYLCRAREVKMQAIVEGIIQIASVSSYKKKYGHLLKKLEELGLIDSNKMFCEKQDQDIEVIYIQPRSTDKDKCINFKQLSEWMKRNYRDNDFEVAFAGRLADWAKD